MSIVKRRIAAVAAGVLAVTGFGVMTPAQADSPGCVTRAEYRAVDKGMLKSKVHRIFDTNGKRLYINHGQVTNEGREYRVCRHPRRGGSYVQVQYDNYKQRGGPLRVGRKQIHISG